MTPNQHLLDQLEGTEIAVVGLALRVPGANNSDQYWDNLKHGREALTQYSDDDLRQAGVSEADINNPHYVKNGAPIQNIALFDAGFFGFSPRDAAIMDPQHRHFLEVCWEALEHAGCDPSRYPGAVGVFGGSGHNAYLPYNLLSNPNLLDSVGFFLLRHTGNDKDFLTTRVSYLFNLTGPSVNVQTACSTSLVAIHMAGQSLLSQECDLALAGGVTFDLPHRQGYLYKEGEIVSPDGHCRAFDAESNGTRFGSGVGVVALKRLEDALQDGDTIHAIIKSSAINNDGAGKVNYLAPSVDGQAKVIAEALALADVEPESISFVEGHGTGTPIGDPIEVAALTTAFGNTAVKQYCALGSVKTNIGHLDTAAGVAGFIKTVLALKHQQIPPNVNFTAPNPHIDFAHTPFYVTGDLQPFPQRNGWPRRAAVNSLGVGGTNAHVVLEEAPVLEPSSDSRPWQLLTLSAKTPTALNKQSQRLADFLQNNPAIPLADIAYTLQQGRQAMAYRRTTAVDSHATAIAHLSQPANLPAPPAAPETPPSIVFMFPGGGAQYPHMGRGLYDTEPVYQAAIDDCLRLVRPFLDCDLRPLIFPNAGQEASAAKELERPSRNLPAIFMVEYALAQLWQSWGITPTALTGHSMGEYTAACLAGVLSLRDALFIVTLRGKLFETLPPGGMLSVPLSEAELHPYLQQLGGLNIAVINSPNLCVVSGELPDLAHLEDALIADGVVPRRVRINVAAHSPMLEPILVEFGRELAKIQFQPPTLPFISNLSGDWITPQEATNPAYWVRHLRHTVRFAAGLATLLQEPNRLFLEVGPGQTLSSLLRLHPHKEASHTAVASLRHRKEKVADQQFALNKLGQIWQAGGTPDWSALYGDELRYRVPLPTYPFEGQRYWVEPGRQKYEAGAGGLGQKNTAVFLPKKENLRDWFYQPSWRQTPFPSLPDSTTASRRWLILADEQGFSEQLAHSLRQAGQTELIMVREGEAYQRLNAHEWTLRTAVREDYDQLINQLEQAGQLPDEIIYARPITLDHVPDTLENLSYFEQVSFYGLLYLAQAWGQSGISQPVRLTVLSNNLHSLGLGAGITPQASKALLLGPVRVIPNEFTAVQCRTIDLVLPPAGSWAAKRLHDQLLRELLTPSPDLVVAHRGNARWVQTFEAAPPPTPLPEKLETPLLRPNGVYLITGGMGALGLNGARYLAETAQARLVLISRSGLPPRAEWGDWLATHSPHETTSRRITAVQELEKAGAEVLVLAADVADLGQMRGVIQQTIAHFGALHGVLHTAGVLDDGLLQLKTTETAAKVMRPKVRGTLVLEEILQENELTLDFCLYYSSVSAITGLAGQVDYAAANAFLDALAQQKMAHGTGARLTLAVNWGAWSEIGMTAKLAQELGLLEPPGLPLPYPLWAEWRDEGEAYQFQMPYRLAEQWVLHEHRLRSGDALISGTGYLELARAAFAQAHGQAMGLVLEEVLFLSPFMVGDDEERTLYLRLDKQSGDFLFKSERDGAWVEHVHGRVTALTNPSPPPPLNLSTLQATCQQRVEQVTENEHAQLDFGPRWQNVRQRAYGENQVLVTLEMPEAFAADLADFHLHPALLDMATGAGQPLIPNFLPERDFFVPFSYGQLTQYAPLTGRLVSHIHYLPQESSAEKGGDTAVFAITILDKTGRVLVKVETFTMRRVDNQGLLSGQPASGATAPASPGSKPVARPLLDTLAAGITPTEGNQLLPHILSGDIWPQVIVVSQELGGLIQQARENTEQEQAGHKGTAVAFARPNLSTPFVAPSSKLEKDIAGIWQDMLGVETVGLDDNFFELGGHSLLLTQLVMRVRKVSNTAVSVMKLFEAATIAEMVAVIGEATAAPVTNMPTLKRVSRDQYRR